MRKRLINWNNLFYQSGESGNCFRRIFLFGNFAMQNATLYLRYTADLKKKDSSYLPDSTGFSRIFVKNDNKYFTHFTNLCKLLDNEWASNGKV